MSWQESESYLSYLNKLPPKSWKIKPNCIFLSFQNLPRSDCCVLVNDAHFLRSIGVCSKWLKLILLICVFFPRTILCSQHFWDRQTIFPSFSLPNRVLKYSLECQASEKPTKRQNFSWVPTLQYANDWNLHNRACTLLSFQRHGINENSSISEARQRKVAVDFHLLNAPVNKTKFLEEGSASSIQ